ncbi:MAG: hypothetical protein RLY93_15225 [Sumerlaeia bacterium]
MWFELTKEAIKNRESVQRWATKLFVGPPIAVTGISGAGKSVMVDALTGLASEAGYEKPSKSLIVDKKSFRDKAQKSKSRLIIIPGQDSESRSRALDQYLDGKDPVEGVIHVVPNGFQKPWDLVGQDALFRRGIDTIEALRRDNLEKEVADFRALCERIAMSNRRKRKPKWLLILATKADLYSGSAREALETYHPDGSSPFAVAAGDLLRKVGTQNLSIDVGIVCSLHESFEWRGEVVESDHGYDQHSSLITLVKFIGEVAKS